MNKARIFLDHNASAPLRPEAREAMLAALSLNGVASSVHAEGRAARRVVEVARAQVAALVGVSAEAVVFTASASEANNMALTPGWQLSGGARSLAQCFVSAIEHPCVLKGSRFSADQVSVLPVGADGRVDPAAWQLGLAAGAGPALVSLMLANNETGIVQPVADVAALSHATGALVHCDAAQAAGKIAVDSGALGVDLMTLSSHKLGGPIGAGALVIANRALHLADPLVKGGGQEKGLRAGTENIAAIAGFGAAAEAAGAALAVESARSLALRDRLEAGLAAIPGIVIFGRDIARLPNTVCLAVPGITAETALMALDLAGFAVSSGSACSSGKVRASHVLAAMGVDVDLARCALRISLGRNNGEADISSFISAFQTVCGAIHKRQTNRAA